MIQRIEKGGKKEGGTFLSIQKGWNQKGELERFTAVSTNQKAPQRKKKKDKKGRQSTFPLPLLIGKKKKRGKRY